jgi:hypothetical protein
LTDHAAERAELTSQIEKLKRREFHCRQAMLDSELADSFAAFRNDLRITGQRSWSWSNGWNPLCLLASLRSLRALAISAVRWTGRGRSPIGAGSGIF